MHEKVERSDLKSVKSDPTIQKTRSYAEIYKQSGSFIYYDIFMELVSP